MCRYSSVTKDSAWTETKGAVEMFKQRHSSNELNEQLGNKLSNAGVADAELDVRKPD